MFTASSLDSHLLYNYVGLGDEVCRWGSVFALELERQTFSALAIATRGYQSLDGLGRPD